MNINQCFISENEKFGHCLYQTIHFRYEQNQLAKRHLVKVPMTRNFDQHFLDYITNGMVTSTFRSHFPKLSAANHSGSKTIYIRMIV